MNKKKIFGALTAALVITISTSVIAFASENVTKSTKDVVKVETTQTQPKTVKNQSQKQSTKAAATNTSTGSKITGDKAIAIAKQTIKNMYGVDLDKEGITEVKFYWPKDFNNGVDDTDQLIKEGFDPIVTVHFFKPNASSLPSYIDAGAKVDISIKDGKVKSAQVRDNVDRRLKDKAHYDDNRIKSVIAQFLKDKGFDTNYTSIKTGGPATCAVIPFSGAYVVYSDRTIWVEVNILNYTVNGYGTCAVKSPLQ